MKGIVQSAVLLGCCLIFLFKLGMVLEPGGACRVWSNRCSLFCPPLSKQTSSPGRNYEKLAKVSRLFSPPAALLCGRLRLRTSSSAH